MQKGQLKQEGRMVVRDIPSIGGDPMVEVYIPLRLPKRIFGLLSDAMSDPDWNGGAGFVAGINWEMIDLTAGWLRDGMFPKFIGPNTAQDLFVKHGITGTYIDKLTRDDKELALKFRIAGIKA